MLVLLATGVMRMCVLAGHGTSRGGCIDSVGGSEGCAGISGLWGRVGSFGSLCPLQLPALFFHTAPNTATVGRKVAFFTL